MPNISSPKWAADVVVAKVDAKGRSRSDHHVRLYDWLTGSDAWRECSGSAIKLLIYIATFDRGENNGQIHMSERFAAEGINVDRKTARKLLRELQEKGFIARTSSGSFKSKRSPAAQWRLTFKPWPAMSKGPTNEWRDWKSGQKRRGEILPSDGGNIPHSPSGNIADGGEITPEPDHDPQKSANEEWGNSVPQLIAIGSDEIPLEAMRSAISAWWCIAKPKDRIGLAKRHKIEVGELSSFVAGHCDLPIQKAVALRTAVVGPTDKAAARA